MDPDAKKRHDEDLRELIIQLHDTLPSPTYCSPNFHEHLGIEPDNFPLEEDDLFKDLEMHLKRIPKISFDPIMSWKSYCGKFQLNKKKINAIHHIILGKIIQRSNCIFDHDVHHSNTFSAYPIYYIYDTIIYSLEVTKLYKTWFNSHVRFSGFRSDGSSTRNHEGDFYFREGSRTHFRCEAKRYSHDRAIFERKMKHMYSSLLYECAIEMRDEIRGIVACNNELIVQNKQLAIMFKNLVRMPSYPNDCPYVRGEYPASDK